MIVLEKKPDLKISLPVLAMLNPMCFSLKFNQCDEQINEKQYSLRNHEIESEKRKRLK